MTQFETGDTLHYDFDARQITHTRDGKVLSCVPLHQPSGAPYTASTPAEFERELSAESGYVKYDNNSLASWEGTKIIPVGDAHEVGHDAGWGFYADKLRGMSWIKGELVETPAHPMCAAMSQPVDPFYQAVTLLMRGEARAAVKRCLADDLATRDFFERGPKPAEVPERAPERAKPPLAGFDVVHEGRWHV
jgi:hypothetical protein